MIRLITEKFRELHEITEKENNKLKKRIAELEKTVEEARKDIAKIEQHESDCHRMLIEERKKYSELREWVIFETNKKPPK